MSPQLAFSSAISVMTMAAFVLLTAAGQLEDARSADSFGSTASLAPTTFSQVSLPQPGKLVAGLR